jgi:hypothetical protein
VTCGKAILSNSMGNQAFSFRLTGQQWDNMQKVSEMMIAVGGDLLKQAGSLDEMQAHLEMVKHAWNISLYSEKKKKAKLKKFIESQKPYAPSKEDLLGLEWEYKRIIKQKEKLYSSVKSKIVIAEAVEKGINDYVIRAYFTGKEVSN